MYSSIVILNRSKGLAHNTLRKQEQIMQNKKTIVGLGVLVLLVGAAAFLAGRMLNGKVGPLGFFGFGGKGAMMSVSINIVPAEELPKTPPEVMGLFVERKDKTIVVQSVPLKAGGGGVVVEKGGGEAVAGSPADLDSGPQVEVVVTNETTIYRENTEFSGPPDGNETIQQTVEESTLNDVNSQSMVTVWGRKSGDRIIAEVLFYSNSIFFKRP
jgi:hypothetical protein